MLLLSLAAALICAFPVYADGPFIELDFDAAVAKAKADGKLLVVDFTATWCPPCKQMERVTWPDEAVRKWIGEHAIAIQVDVDREPALAQRFGFDAIPTVIFLRDGEELDRYTGFRDAAGLISVADSLLKDGRTARERAEQEIKRLAGSNVPFDLFTVGRDLVLLGRLDEATQSFARAFELGRGVPGEFLWRLDELLGDMQELADKHEAAREAFGKLVDAAEVRVNAKDPPVFAEWSEWVQMCQAFGRVGDVLRWYDAKRDAQGRLFGGGDLKDPPPDVGMMTYNLPPVFEPRRSLDSIRNRVVDLLAEAGRVEDSLALMEDPVARAREEFDDSGIKAMFGALSGAASRAEMVQRQLDQCFFGIAKIHALALAGGRKEQATQIAQLVLDRDKSGMGRTWLVSFALDRGVATVDPCARWLDEAEKLGAPDWGLRERLTEPAVAAPAGG